jgi:phosphatidylinositol glycan class B
MSFKKIYQKNKLYLFSYLFLILSSIFSVGFYHPDEHYQILEFANYKLGNINSSQLPWEFHEKIRPTLQPLLALITIKILNCISIDSPFTISLILRLFSSTLSLYTLNKLFYFFVKEFESEHLQKWFKLFSFFCWFLLFLGVRFSSENWSTCIFIIGLLLFFSSEKKLKKDYFILGLFFGFSFIIRFQSAFLIMGFVLWMVFINKTRILTLIYLIISIFLIIIMGVLIDTWFYQSFTFTPYNYFYQNIILNKAENFGIEPWWYYFKSSFEKGIPPISIVFIIATIYFFVKHLKDPITWSFLPFILAHFYIGHKELRFLFPILYFLPYFLIKSIENFTKNKSISINQNRYINISIQFIFILNITIYSIVIFRPMTTKIFLFEFVYNNYEEITSIYYTDNNPFEEINFYKRKKLEIIKVDQKDIKKWRLNNNTNKLIITIPEKRNLFKDKKILFQTYPLWLNNFNFRNWMKKSEQYLIYKL